MVKGFRGRSSEALNRLDLGGSRPVKKTEVENSGGGHSRRASLTTTDLLLPDVVDNYVGKTGRRASLDPSQLRIIKIGESGFLITKPTDDFELPDKGDNFIQHELLSNGQHQPSVDINSVPTISVTEEPSIARSHGETTECAGSKQDADDEEEEMARIALYRQLRSGRRASFDPSQLTASSGSGSNGVVMRRRPETDGGQNLSKGTEEDGARALFYAQRYGGRRASLDPSQLESMQKLQRQPEPQQRDEEEENARALFYAQRYGGRRTSLDPSQIASMLADEQASGLQNSASTSYEEQNMLVEGCGAASVPPQPRPRSRSKPADSSLLLRPETVDENEMLSPKPRAARRASIDPSQLYSVTQAAQAAVSKADSNSGSSNASSTHAFEPTGNHLMPASSPVSQSRRKSLPALLGPMPAELLALAEEPKSKKKSSSSRKKKPLDGGVLMIEGKIFKSPARGSGADSTSTTAEKSTSAAVAQKTQLQEEIAHSAGVKVTAYRKDVKYAMFVDIHSHVWVAGWNQKERPLLYNIFHVGDKVLSVNGFALDSAKQLWKMIKRADSDTKFEFVLRRLPFGKAYHIRRGFDNEELGIQLRDGSNEVISVSRDSLVGVQGLRVNPNKAYGFGQCHWVVTEVNDRPLNLVDTSSEAHNRLESSGKDVTFVVQPQDFIELLIKQLKTEFHWKDYLVY